MASPVNEREQRAAATITRISDDDFTGAREWFGDVMQPLTSERLKEVWSQIIAQFGAYQGRGEFKAGNVEGHPVLESKIVFERGHLNARVVFDDNDKVVGFFLLPAP